MVSFFAGSAPVRKRVSFLPFGERKQNVMIQLQLGGMKGHRNDLSATYNEAVHRFAELEAHTPSELFFKAGYGYAVDNREGLIAKSVIRDLYNFRTRLLPELVSA